jgi:Tfp pilus assembly protein PilO
MPQLKLKAFWQWFGPILAGLAVLLVGWRTLIQPQLASRTQLTERLEQLGESTTQFERYLADVDELEEAYRTARGSAGEQLAKVRQALPSSPNNAELFAQFQELIEGNGLVLVGMSIGPTDTRAEPPYVTEVSFSVAGGSYLVMKGLLDTLERHLRLLDVISLTFDSQVQNYTVVARLYSTR